MNTTSTVVPRWFRGHNETIRIAGPGEKPSIPVSQRSEQEQSALVAAKASASATKQAGATSSGALPLLTPLQAQSQSQLQSQLQTQSQLQPQPHQLQIRPPPQPQPPPNDEESDWDRDLRMIRENEYWEGRIVDIPTLELQHRYRDKFADIGLYQKIGIFKMLEYFEWSYERCVQLVLILEKTPPDLVMNMVELLQELEKTLRYLDIGIDFFVGLDGPTFRDLIGAYNCVFGGDVLFAACRVLWPVY